MPSKERWFRSIPTTARRWTEQLLRQSAGNPGESPKASARPTPYESGLKHCQAAAKSLLAVSGVLDNRQIRDLERALSAIFKAAGELGVG